MSLWFNTVKRFYDNRHPLYTNESLKGFVQTKMITAHEYQEITNIPYEA
ncbi:XkdX family protein [Robertmurraya sp. DFI.2.37]|nr:XkdX family protein [Robertmurraya sp. DFI.2.37]MDF1510605.1 XkdX family protein [Robertmurraya sp. DFI.2.37]